MSSGNKKSKKWAFHVAAWLACILLLEGEEFLAEPFSFSDLALTLSYFGMLATCFYAVYGWVLPRYMQSNRKVILLLLLCSPLLLFPVMRFGIEEVLYPWCFGFSNYTDPQLPFYFKDNYWRVIPFILVATLLYTVENQIRHEQQQQALQAEKTQAELAFLRSQLNPHFLFNTLHYLHTRAFKVDTELADSILQLADLLRSSLHTARKDTIPISEEVSLLHTYINLQKKRFEDQIQVVFTVEGQDLSARVEPLLLLPFVENAFKHGQLKAADVPLKIKLRVLPDRLYFHCSNRVGKGSVDHISGIGVANIRRRLELKYPQKHQLQITSEEDIFLVTLILQL